MLKIVELRTAWAPPKGPEGRAFPGGSLLAAPLDAVMDEDWSGLTCLFEPTPSASLQSQSGTKNYLVLKVRSRVKHKVPPYQGLGPCSFLSPRGLPAPTRSSTM